MTKNIDEFYNDLGVRESGGNYSSINKYGYLGKYQMGEAAMVDAGYYKKTSRIYNNDWTGQFTGKDGIYNVQDFLNNKQSQENAQKTFKQAQWNQLKAIGADKYIGKEINGVKITQSGLLAAAHLKGPGAVKEYLQSNGKNIPKDAFGTSVESYMKKFADYDVSSITGTPNPINNNNNDLTNKPNLTYNENTPFKLGIEYNNSMQNNSPNLNDLIVNPNNQSQQNTTNPWDNIPMAIPESLKQPEGIPTGHATNFDINQLAQILDLKSWNTPIQQNQSGLSDYANPLTGNKRIYTREDIGAMTSDEFSKLEKEIDAQIQAMNGTMPTDGDLQREAMTSGSVVYVNTYNRSDGTKVKGYYRSRPNY
ncbi:hypothetical protein HDR58_01245 [bacterium]|nr:hypothetical protein [bacterium]